MFSLLNTLCKKIKSELEKLGGKKYQSTNNLLAAMKLELIPSDYFDKNCKCLPQGSLVQLLQ